MQIAHGADCLGFRYDAAQDALPFDLSLA